MSQFPGPLQLPDFVQATRLERSRQMTSSVKKGMAIRSLIIIAEFIAFFFFGSASLFLDALASSLDVISSGALLLCVRLAERPPDEDHPFGHGRYEPLAGLLLASSMAFLGVVMIIQQVFQVLSISHSTPLDPRSWIIPFFAVVLLEICYHIVMHAAKKNHSPALEADAAHYRVDAINSLFAAIALGAGVFWPDWSQLLDHFGAILIAILMIGLGLHASKRNFHQLMDRKPEDQFFRTTKSAALNVEGVLATEKLRIQQFGPDAHVSIDIEVDPQLTVDVAHQISQEVRVEIQKAWPAVRDVIVHIEPYYPGDH